MTGNAHLADVSGAVLPAANLEACGFAHGFFTRRGGVSEGIYASLNCGRGSKDDEARVAENRLRVAACLGVGGRALIGPWQAHSALAVIAEGAWEPADAPRADAVVTNIRHLAVSVLTADCVPLLLGSAEAGVIGAAHAGWKGAKAGVVEAAVSAMGRLGARPEDIAAAVGPAISRAAYEVGPDFRDAFLAGAGANARYFSPPQTGGKPRFDLPAYVRDRLAASGVRNIEMLDRCTYANESLFFSHRRAVHRGEADYGRQISAIVLQ